MSGPPRIPVSDRFWDKVAKSDECWMWTAGHTPKGYGMVKVSGRHHGAHRVAWMLTNGPIPTGKAVLHRCDNPPCVRPDHLWLGTVGDNNRDREAKGRSGRPHPPLKLSFSDCQEIRRLYALGGVSQSALGKRYSVHQVTISDIVLNRKRVTR